jgi:hypothetical protein
MVHPSTLRALGLRATRTARWLEKCAKQLENEMKNQHLDPCPEWRASDNLMTMTLARGDVRKLIRGMYDCVAEIRRFSN